MLDKYWKLDQNWNSLDKIVVYGCGRFGRKVIKKLRKDFGIVAIVDSDIRKCNQVIDGVEVKHLNDAIELLKYYKVIVATMEHYYIEIKTKLIEIGLKEYLDFVMVQQFISEWYYKNRREICMAKVDIFTTPFCTLNCKKCVQFVPFWKEKKEIPFDDLKNTIDAFFRNVDFVFTMQLSGGEPFLHKDLSKIIQYIGDNYLDRIGYFGIVTNGTIIPSKIMIGLLTKYKMGVSVSDYSHAIQYKDKIDKLCALLKQNDIEYLRNKDLEWYDIGFPQEKYLYKNEDVKTHYLSCNSMMHILCEEKFFYCHIQFAAYKSGLFPLYDNDYIDLNSIAVDDTIARQKLLAFSIGQIEGGYLEFCKVCGGFGIDNDNIITSAEQLIGEECSE